MPITALPTPPSRTNPSQFSAQTDTFLAALPQFVSDANSLAANLNAIAFGGAYALPYMWGGGINTGSGNQSAATALAISNTTSTGVNVLPLLKQFDASSSAVKGQIKVVAQGDVTRWLVFNLTSRNDSGTYQGMNGVTVMASSANPFNSGDAVIVQYQRTGDKGDKGDSAAIYQVIVRDQRGANVSPQSLTGNTWNRRVLNTVVGNQIVGFQLGAAAANTFTLPAGTYWIEATAPAQNPSSQQLRLFNVTQNATYDIGGSDYSNSGSTSVPSTQRAILRTFLSTTADTVFAIEHYIGASGPNGTGGTGGTASSSGIGEIYTELQIVKVG